MAVIRLLPFPAITCLPDRHDDDIVAIACEGSAVGAVQKKCVVGIAADQQIRVAVGKQHCSARRVRRQDDRFVGEI